MFKLLVLCCLLVSCLAGSFSVPSWIQNAAKPFLPPRGCADRTAGWVACARANASDVLAPHPHDCRLFYYCSSSVAKPACRRCPIGLHFNPELQVCDWPDHANCTASPRPPRPRPTGRPDHNGTTSEPPSEPSTDAPASTTDASIPTLSDYDKFNQTFSPSY